jgi:hypothetical protein
LTPRARSIDILCISYEAVASSPAAEAKQLLGPDQVSVLNTDFRFGPAKVLRTDFSLVIATNLS